MRRPENFREAHTVVQKYIINLKMMQFPELMVQFGTILDALAIAEYVAREHQIKQEATQKMTEQKMASDNSEDLDDQG